MSSTYYIRQGNETQGPLTSAQLSALRDRGQVGADTPVCPVGSQTWTRLGEVTLASSGAQGGEVINPYAAPASAVGASSIPEEVPDLGGINRLTFILIVIAIWVGAVFLGPNAVLLSGFVMMLPAISRLKNIGTHPAWCLLLPVPLLGLFITVRCMMLPAGFDLHRKLDLPAKLIAGALVLVLVVVLYLVFARE